MYKPSVCHQEFPPLNRLQLIYKLLWNICLLVAQRIAREVEEQQLALLGDRSAHKAATRRGRPPKGAKPRGRPPKVALHIYGASTYIYALALHACAHALPLVYICTAPAGRMQWGDKFCGVYIYTYTCI